MPDDRVARLAELFRPRKTTFAEITYRDVGLTKGAGAGEGVSSKRLGDLRTVDALVHVVRAFRDENVPHAEGSVDPLRDLHALDLELLVADHGVVERRLERIDSELRSAKGPEREARERERALLGRALAALDAETPLRDVDLDPDEEKLVRGYRFLTRMPQLVVANLDEADVRRADEAVAPLREAAAAHRASAVVPVCARIEAEIAELEANEATAFRADLGLREPALERIVRATYELLGLVSFVTTGDDEVRAWTVERGASAQQAAGTIHSDLERGFIRAEVVRWDDLLRCGSEAAAKREGLVRTESRSYAVADGDVLKVLFNVAPRT